MRGTLSLCLLLPVLLSCGAPAEEQPVNTRAWIVNDIDSGVVQPNSSGSTEFIPEKGINTGNTDPATLLAFAKTLKGIPYKYASSDPASGFDCSGFITYVFNHFGIAVPRSSADFSDQGTPVTLGFAKPGDLILFTGTDSSIRTVGHMGIITYAGDSIVFIHSTSGKADGVTETTLNPYYMERFVKVIRVFE